MGIEIFDPESEPIFATAFAYAAIGMALVRPDGQWLRVNKSLCDFLGYSGEEFLAMRYQDVTHPDDLVDDMESVRRVLSREINTYQMEKRYIHKLGHVVWAQLSVSLIRDGDGEPRFFISQITDINEHKLAELALQRNKERLEFVIEGTGVGLWDWQVQTGVTVFNERWAEIIGYTLDELSPLSIETWNRFAHPEDLQRADQALAEHFAGESEYYESEVRMQHRDGHWVWVLDRGKVVEWDAGGKPLRMAGTHLDISARKRAELEARRYNRLYATLNQVNQIIMRTKNRQTLFTRICEAAVEYSHFLLVCVVEIDRATGDARPVASAGNAPTYLDHIRLNINRLETMVGPTGIALRTEQLCVSQNIATDAHMERWRDLAAEYGFRSSAAIPLRQRGEVIGTLNLYAAEMGFFNRQEQELLNAISGDISFALDAIQAEVETQSARELFARLFRLSPVPKALVRLRDNVFVDVNAAFEELLGLPSVEILGRTAAELNIWADRALRQELLETVIRSGPIRDAEFTFHNAVGEARTGILYAEIIRHAGEDYILSNTVDITDRKQMEDSLARNSEALRLRVSALEAAANAIVIANRDGILEWVNPAFTALTGYEAEEAIGKNLRDLVKSDKQPTSFYRDLWQTIATGNVWRGELINRRKDGTLYIEEQTITPVRNKDGDISHYIAIKTDVSRDREIQAQIQRQDRLAAIGQLAAGIAHDFNNIMAVIVLYSQIVARSTLISDRERERLLTIHQQAEHAAHMIRQILDFSRQGIMERRPLDLLPTLTDHVKLLQRTLPENIEVRLTAEHSESVVLADPTRIQQVVMNLAVNARDAMPNGGTLRLHLKHAFLGGSQAPVSDMEPGVWVCLAVSDTGTGIAPEVIPHLFEPFFTTKDPGKGTGLGLPQVYGIVGEHGGHITVASDVGKGTTFTIYLPEINVSNPQPTITEFAEIPKGNQETVLVVEDNQVVREAVVEVLQQLNYRTEEATDGEAALAFLATSPPIDVILTDLVMPKMGGVDMVRALYAQDVVTPIIIMTGHPLENDLDTLRRLGLGSWLMKPPTPTQLSDAIVNALKRKTA